MNKKIISLFALMVLLSLPVLVLAQPQDPGPEIAQILYNVLVLMDFIFAGLAGVMFAWGGILYLTAHGDPGQIQKATKILIWGVVGAAVFAVSLSIASWVDFIIG